MLHHHKGRSWLPVLCPVLLIFAMALSLSCSGSEDDAIATPASSTTKAQSSATEKASPAPIPEAKEVPSLLDRTWERERIAAVSLLYTLTPAGRQVIDSLDLRQMWGQPLYFKSSGFKGWAGVGEAKPAGVVHELSHSYWGAFLVSGYPDLDWQVDQNPWQSPAMEQYHQDVLTFMAQPPDHFDVLRERWRDPPDATLAQPGVLFHLVEADLVPSVGGDLNLVPPILRKYWDSFLQPGAFGDWYQAVAWYDSLGNEDRSLADTYLGFNHLDRRSYAHLDHTGEKDLPDEVRQVLQGEERQRLEDFARQFTSFTGPPEAEEDYNGWRGYLKDMVQLHGRYPELVGSLDIPEAEELAATLDFLGAMGERTPEHRVALLTQQVGTLPLLQYLWPGLDNRTLVLLFSQEEVPVGRQTFKGFARFTHLVQIQAPQVASVVVLAQSNVPGAAHSLASILDSMDWDGQQEVQLFLDLLKDTNSQAASQVVAALEPGMLKRLLKVAPVQIRLILQPQTLLAALGIAEGATRQVMIEGINMLVQNTSRASRVDQPFVNQLYQVMAARATVSPTEALAIIAGSSFPLEGFIQQYPQQATAVLDSDLHVAASLVQASDPIRLPPARLVYRLIQTSPDLAAQLVQALDQEGASSLVLDSLAYFAYDASRLARLPSLPISLEKNGQFLRTLLEMMGEARLRERLADMVSLQQAKMERQEAPQDFMASYWETWRMAVASLPDSDPLKAVLRDVAEDLLS